MAEIRFYQISDSNKLLTAAMLTETLYREKKRLCIVFDDKEQALAFDEYLWQFKPNSFIPHNLIDESLYPPPPVLVGTVSQTIPNTDVLINLSTQTLTTRTKQLIEIIAKDDPELDRLRAAYREYQRHGHHVSFQNIAASETV